VLVFSPDGHRLAIGGDAGMLLVLDCRSLKVEKVKTDTGDGVTALAFSPLGRVLAAGFGFTSGNIRLWDINSLQACGRLTNHTMWVTALAFSSDGRRLVSVGEDWTLRVWSMPGSVEVRCLQTSQNTIGTLALLGDGKTLVTGDKAGTVCLWDLSAAGKGQGHTNLPISYAIELEPKVAVESYEIGNLDPKVVCRFGLAYAPDARSFVTTDRDGFLALYDARSLQVLEPLPALGSNNWAVALSPDGRWLAAGHASGRITICDWKTRTATTNVLTPFEWVGRLRFSASGRFLVASVVFNDQSVQTRIWRTNDWSEVPLQSFIGKDLFFHNLSPDDDLLAAGYTDGAVRLWKFPSGQLVATLRQQKVRNNELRFSPDGRLLVAAGGDGSVVLWDVRAARQVAVLRGHSFAAWSAAFSPDGRRLATGGTGASDAVKLWDLATHRELLCLSQEGSFFCDASFSPDGNTLQATSFSGVAHLWRAPSWAEIEAAEKGQKAK
jgi:WD40 repeat protein